MGVSGRFNAAATCNTTHSPENRQSTQLIGGGSYLGSIVGLDISEKKQSSWLCLDSNPEFSSP